MYDVSRDKPRRNLKALADKLPKDRLRVWNIGISMPKTAYFVSEIFQRPMLSHNGFAAMN